MKLATASQMKELDRQAIEERNIPSIDLMERAAEGVARAAQQRRGRHRRRPAAVFEGPEDPGVSGGEL